jgi:hypothetical protein
MDIEVIVFLFYIFLFFETVSATIYYLRHVFKYLNIWAKDPNWKQAFLDKSDYGCDERRGPVCIGHSMMAEAALSQLSPSITGTQNLFLKHI